MPSRSAFTCATCHHAFSCSSALAASSSASRRRLPRVGRLDPHRLDRLAQADVGRLRGLRPWRGTLAAAVG